MNAQPLVFSGTLKVQGCHVFWTKTPVQLTCHRQDYRHALPVLLIRRPSVLGGEFRVPLDPCIHPVRLLPMTKGMSSKFEFALEYGWHTKQVRLRTPDANTYRQWTSLVRVALESGRRPLASCTVERPQQDLECSSLASTMNSSNNGSSRFNVTIPRRVHEEEQEEEVIIQQHLDHDRSPRWQPPSEFFVLHNANYHPHARPSVEDDRDIASPSSAAIGSRSCDRAQRDVHPNPVDRCFWPSRRVHSNFHIDSTAIIHELFLQSSFWYFLL